MRDDKEGGGRGVQQGRASVDVVDTHSHGSKVKVTGRPKMECDAEVNGLCALLSGLVLSRLFVLPYPVSSWLL